MHEEAFLNDIWNGFTTEGRFDLLAKAFGEKMLEETYDVWLMEFTAKESSDQEEPIEDLNPETR